MPVARTGYLGVEINGTNPGTRLDPGYAWYDAAEADLSPTAIAGPPAIPPVGGPGDGPNLLEHQSTGFPFGAEQCKYTIASGEVPGLQVVQKEVRPDTGSNPWPVGVQDEFAWAGIPTQVGVFTIVIGPASHTGSPGFAGETYIWTISLVPGCPLINITPDPPEFATLGEPFTHVFSGDAGTLPYVFDVISGTIPDGLTLDPDGTLSGTPTVEGPFDFTIRLVDDNGCTAVSAYTLTIANSPLVVTIGGLDSAPFQARKFSFYETANGRGRLTGTIRALTGGYIPALDDEVIVFEDGIRIFAGTIDHTSTARAEEGASYAQIETEIDVSDFNELAERAYFTGTLSAGTLKSQLEAVLPYLADYDITLDVGQVDGPTLDAVSYADATPVAQVLTDIATAADGWIWWIDYYKRLSAYEPGTLAAPFDIDDTSSAVLLRGDVVVTRDRANYANRVILYFNAGAVAAWAFVRASANFANGETLDIGARTYTFQTVLTDVDGHVLIGSDTAESLANLQAAINLEAGAGTLYATSTTENTDVEAWYGPAADLIRVRARRAGSEGNSIAVSETCANAEWIGEGSISTSTLLLGSDEALTNYVVADDAGEQTTRGIKTVVISIPQILTYAAAQAQAETYLAQKIVQARTVTYRVRSSGAASIVRPGMAQSIYAPSRGIDVATDFLVNEVRTTHIWRHKLDRTVTAVETLRWDRALGFQDTYRRWAEGGGTGTSAVASIASTAGGSSASAGAILDDGTVPMAAPLDLGGNAITDVDDPANAQDAATKAYVDAVAGGLVLLASRAANNTATSIDHLTRNAAGQSGDLFQADFDNYLIRFVGLVPATNGVGFGIRVSTDGATFVSAANNYSWSHRAYGPGGAGETNANGTGTEIRTVGFVNVRNTSTSSLNGVIECFSPLSTALWKIFGGSTHFYDTTPGLVWDGFSGAYIQTTALRGLQVVTTAGNIVSGEVLIYGIKK